MLMLNTSDAATSDDLMDAIGDYADVLDLDADQVKLALVKMIRRAATAEDLKQNCALVRLSHG